MSVFKVNVVAGNPKREELFTPSLEALVDYLAQRLVATTTLAAGTKTK